MMIMITEMILIMMMPMVVVVMIFMLVMVITEMVLMMMMMMMVVVVMTMITYGLTEAIRLTLGKRLATLKRPMKLLDEEQTQKDWKERRAGLTTTSHCF